MSGTVNLKAVADVNKAIYETQRLERSLGTLGKTGETTGSKLGHALGVGLKVAAVAGAVGLAAVAYGAKKALDAAGDFQQQLNVLQATSGATARQLKALSAEAIKLGADAKLPATSAKDAADAMTELSKAGLSVKDTMAAARPVLQLSAAAQISNADAAIYTATALNSFHLQGTKAAQVADLLAAAANASAGDVPAMGEALQFAGSAAHGAGQKIDDVVAAISEMSNAGLSGSVAGSSLAQVFRSLEAPTAKAKEALDKYNISIYDSQGKMRPLRDLVAQFSGKLGGLTQAQKNQTLAQLFGSRAVQAARIVLDGGTKSYDKMHKAVTKVGAAQKLAEAQTKGFKGALQKFQSAAETLGIVIGLKLLPVATDVATALGNIVSDISKVAAAPSLKVGIKLLVNMGGHVYESIKAALLGETKQVKGPQLGRGGAGATNQAVTVQTTGILQQLQRSIEGVDWAAIGQQVGTALGSAIKFTAGTASSIVSSLADAIVANRGKLAQASVLIAASIIETLTDPVFWVQNWQDAIAVALALLPAARFARIGELAFGVFGRAGIRILSRILLRLPNVVQDAVFAVRILFSRTFGRIARDILARITGSATRFPNVFQRAAAAIISAMGRAWSEIVSAGSAAIERVGNRIQKSLIGRIAVFAAKVLGITAAFQAIGDAVQYVIDKVQELIGWIGKINFPSIPNPGGGVPFVPGIASGGTVMRGGWAVVGERGPELAHLPGGTTIYDAKQTKAASRGGATVTNHITLNMQQTDPMLALSYLGIKLDRAVGIPS